ncbi:MAG: hypothetical protein AAB348_00420 [Patescibacteria group bacterium]
MENEAQPTSKSKTIKSIYFYLVSFVALMMVVFSTADIINIVLKTWVFTKADADYYAPYLSCDSLKTAPVPENRKTAPVMSAEECARQNEISRKSQDDSRAAQKQRDVVRDISMIVVGIPLFMIHWRIVRRKDENL